MDRKEEATYVLLLTGIAIAISAALVASSFITSGQFVEKAFAQGNTTLGKATRSVMNNPTGNSTIANKTGGTTTDKTTNQSSVAAATNQGSINTVLNAVRNTNATSMATQNIINATASNSTMANKTNSSNSTMMTNKTG
jgi:hypothetical protein